MATRLFLHAALFNTVAFPGSYPDSSGEIQVSIVNPQPTFGRGGTDAVTVHRSMDTIKGTDETSFNVVGQAFNGTQMSYVTKFISPPLIGVTQIDAVTWVSATGKLETSLSSNFSGMLICLYVWRPSTNTKVGSNIYNASGEGGFLEPASINTERLGKGNFTAGAGAQVTGVQNGDVLIAEIYVRKSQTVATSYTDNWYYDGTNEHNATATGSIVTDVASYIETSQNLTFQSAEQTATSTGKQVINKFITKA